VRWVAVEDLKATLASAGAIDSTTAVALHRVFGTFFDRD
jgi:hypothetical protein